MMLTSGDIWAKLARAGASTPDWRPRMGHRIAIIGNLNIDLILRGIEQMPAWGQEVMGTGHTAASAGQAGTLAMCLAHLGVPVSVVSAVGTDQFGDQILRDLGNAGVDLTAVERI